MAIKTDKKNIEMNGKIRRPDWLKVRLGSGETYTGVRKLVSDEKLHTVCESARCPNIGECWSRKTATFMILGDTCTRSCRFCNIKTGQPTHFDNEEPKRVAEAVQKLKLKHAVITSVTRDDLNDGGAAMFSETIQAIRNASPSCSIETLISDFKGDMDALQMVLDAKPDILNHNIETVERLQRAVRVQATYSRSLAVLQYSKEKGMITKSGLMVGLGETKEEVIQTMKDLRAIDCDIITIGQYMPPTKEHYPLTRFYTPDEFKDLKEKAKELGFEYVESGPFVRSSYHAEKHANLAS
jgi:lipoic acid synthetase